MRFLEFDTLTEILLTMRENKLRTFLTGFAVAWGIFMLIILLGSGNGLKNGVTSNFNDRASNTMMLWGGRTTMPYKGLKAYRKNQLPRGKPRGMKKRYVFIHKANLRFLSVLKTLGFQTILFDPGASPEEFS